MDKSAESFYHYPLSSIKEEGTPMSYAEYGVKEGGKKLSIVVPLFNEENNVQPVVEDLEETLSTLEIGYEIILVDDGSTDDTRDVARTLAREYATVKAFSHETNKGKSAAMMTGFRHVEGDYVVLMDGDGQFLAQDIPNMIEKLEEGYDVVNGWGKKKEPITKIIPSLIYNGISRKLFSLSVHQFNLGYKAFKREAVKDIFLKKDEHRYILPLLKEKGCTIAEVPVAYLPRQSGKSKYGVTRIPTGILDMVALKLELMFGERPFRPLGMASLALILLGIIPGVHALQGWISGSMSMWSMVLSVIFFLSGINMLLIGYAVEAVKYSHR
jgi:glycosyltransferase involved in cell wall biosynthesis